MWIDFECGACGKKEQIYAPEDADVAKLVEKAQAVADKLWFAPSGPAEKALEDLRAVLAK